jgi:autophagy-related protein 11
VTEADEQAYHELTEQLRETQQSKAQQESLFQEERDSFQAEIHRLDAGLQEVNARAKDEQERANRLERELHHVRGQAESDMTARRILEQRNSELSSEAETQRNALGRALAEATNQTKEAEILRQQLVQVQAEFDDVKALEARNSDKFAKLLEDQTTTLRNLEEARARGEDLEAQIQGARTESDDVKQSLMEATREKDRLLRAQASEHDRLLRDHIAEADGDRAVLEHQFHELKAIMEDTERKLKDAIAQNEVSCADAVGLREELQRVEHELREARHVERVLRDDLKAGRASQSDFEQRLENSGRLIAQILDVAIAFRNSHVKALHSAQAMSTNPGSGSKQSMLMSDTHFPRHSVIGQPDDASPIDPSDPPSALDALRAFDHDHFLESITKIGSTIRKWQKQCKEYRERAKGKISFRNFAKGDLALFLPTRNSVSKPWAAFNGALFFYPDLPVEKILTSNLFTSILPSLFSAGNRPFGRAAQDPRMDRCAYHINSGACRGF